ncbi:MAG: 2-C-methyl-D-erythritol 4-phosphate cytidylyltransferase [Deltaproteobacteria bacterium]|nr:2-C-methyl-D-erythritol 4-phosphate cytidylyltransferase [Deltaproteobacteria bacterium]
MPVLKTVAIIPSAGLGRRMGSQKKNYLDLLARPILAHTLGAFERCSSIDSVIVVVTPGDEVFCRKDIIERFGLRKAARVIAGGAERQDSVYNALEYTDGFDLIAVHDGARPLVTVEIIEAVIRAATESGSAIAAVPVKDTVKSISDGFVEKTIDRTSLVSVQTPQVFRRDILLQSFDQARRDNYKGTDESSLAERAGFKVKAVPGSYENIKITTPEDIIIAESILRNRAG